MTLRLSLLTFAFIAACGTDSSKSTRSGGDVTTTDTTDGDGADGTDGADATDGEVTVTGQEALSSGGTYRGTLSGLGDGLSLGETATGSLVVSLAAGGAPGSIAIEASFIHQGMGHGGPKAPKLTGGTDGAYTVADLVPSMAGTWELLLEITGATGMETITFEIIVTP